MEQLFQLIQHVISKEEKVWHYTSKCQSIPIVVSKQENKSRSWISEKTYYCMYCKADHKAFNCNIYKTPYEGSQYLQLTKCGPFAHPHTMTLLIARSHLASNARGGTIVFVLSPINVERNKPS
uniref:Retrotransposon gag protein n=1 Tax=Angiostrongylus cantonensis TaxID=6313 RepID=A0A0K0DQ77_ANGCA